MNISEMTGKRKSISEVCRSISAAGGFLAIALVASAAAFPAHAQTESLTVAIAPNPPTMTTLALGVAEHQGYFEEFGVNVEIIFVDGSTTALRGLEAGQSDVGINAAVSQIPAVANGARVKQFYGLTQAIAHQYLVPESIASCEDLRGKVVAIDSVGGLVETLTRAFLASCGLTPNDVTYASNMLGTAAVQAMVNGQVFGMAYAPEAAQLYISRFPEQNLHVIGRFASIVPNEAGQGLGASIDTLSNRKEALTRFTAGLIKANAFMNDPANKDRVIEIAQTFMSATAVDHIVVAYDDYLADRIFPARGEIGLPQGRVEFTTNRLAEAGFFPADKTPAYEDLVDTSIFEAADALVNSSTN